MGSFAAGITIQSASQITTILHQLTDWRGAQVFGYDSLDRLTSASHPLLATPPAFAYDPVGNRTTNSSVVNTGNQLTADANYAYQYDDNGNLTRKTLLATGNYTQYTYDAENRLIKVEDFAAGNPTPAFTSTYRYDGLGRRIEKVANGQTKRYIYDGEDILLEYDVTNMLQVRYTHGPGIDEPVARTLWAATGSGPTATVVLASTPDGLGGIVVDDTLVVNGQRVGGFLYDPTKPTPAIGQPIDSTGSHLPIPPRDITALAVSGQVQVDLVDTGSIGGNRPVYLVRLDAAQQPLESRLLFAARPTFVSPQPVGTPVAYASTTVPVTTSVANATVFYHQDGLGSVTDLTDSTGAVAKSYSYDAYGNILESPGALEQPYTYTGREFDAESGLYYYRARYYDPANGRFVRYDPIGLRGGLNLYRYAFDNPIRFTDPQGTDAWVGGEGSGIAQAGVFGFQAGGGAIVNASTGEVCRFSVTCGRVGLGLILSAGGKGIAQLFAPRCGKDVGGWSFALAGDIVIPGYPGLGGSVGGGGGLGVGAAIGPDVGAGISGGIDICYVKIKGCLNTPPDCEDCSNSKK